MKFYKVPLLESVSRKREEKVQILELLNCMKGCDDQSLYNTIEPLDQQKIIDNMVSGLMDESEQEQYRQHLEDLSVPDLLDEYIEVAIDIYFGDDDYTMLATLIEMEELREITHKEFGISIWILFVQLEMFYPETDNVYSAVFHYFMKNLPCFAQNIDTDTYKDLMEF